MLEHILTSTMAFFDTTPIGRIINRFSKDIDEVDLMIPTHIKGKTSQCISKINNLLKPYLKKFNDTNIFEQFYL